MQVEVVLTRQDIWRGEFVKPRACPLALALRRTFPAFEVLVGGNYWSMCDKWGIVAKGNIPVKIRWLLFLSLPFKSFVYLLAWRGVRFKVEVPPAVFLEALLPSSPPSRSLQSTG